MKFGQLPKAFKPRRPARLSRGGGFNPDREEEAPLTGKVQNMKAAQGEERFARTLQKGMSQKIVREHRFRWTTLKRGTVGYKELDELVFLTNGRIEAISIKGTTFVHRGSSASEQDKINEIIQLQALRKLGYNVDKITTIPAEKLKSQQEADEVGRKLGVYR